MENDIKDLAPALEIPVAIESIAAPIPEIVEPNNNARDFGILVGVVVVAAICAKVYACTAKN